MPFPAFLRADTKKERSEKRPSILPCTYLGSRIACTHRGSVRPSVRLVMHCRCQPRGAGTITHFYHFIKLRERRGAEDIFFFWGGGGGQGTTMTFSLLKMVGEGKARQNRGKNRKSQETHFCRTGGRRIRAEPSFAQIHPFLLSFSLSPSFLALRLCLPPFRLWEINAGREGK